MYAFSPHKAGLKYVVVTGVSRSVIDSIREERGAERSRRCSASPIFFVYTSIHRSQKSSLHFRYNMPPCKWGKDIFPCPFLQWLIVQLAQHNRGICLACQWEHGTVFWFLVGFPNWHVSGCHFQVPVGAWSCLLVLSKTGKNGSLGMMPLVDS